MHRKNAAFYPSWMEPKPLNRFWWNLAWLPNAYIQDPTQSNNFVGGSTLLVVWANMSLVKTRSFFSFSFFASFATHLCHKVELSFKKSPGHISWPILTIYHVRQKNCTVLFLEEFKFTTPSLLLLPIARTYIAKSPDVVHFRSRAFRDFEKVE